MRALSASVVVLAGAVLIVAACMPGVPNQVSNQVGVTGGLVGALGLLIWLIMLFLDVGSRKQGE